MFTGSHPPTSPTLSVSDPAITRANVPCVTGPPDWQEKLQNNDTLVSQRKGVVPQGPDPKPVPRSPALTIVNFHTLGSQDKPTAHWQRTDSSN